MTITESLNKLIENITGQDNPKPETITESLKDLIEALGGGASIKPSDDTISEFVDVLAEVLPKKIGINPTGTILITENGTTDVTEYAGADVAVPQPSGKITITENGTDINVNDYATADVNVDTFISELTGIIQRTGTTLNIPSGVTVIGTSAFTNYNAMEHVTIPSTVSIIKASAFSDTGISSVEIPNGVTELEDYAFSYCPNLTSVIIPTSVITLGSGVFTGSNGITDIYYEGTQAQWEAITGLSDAGVPAGATVHYEYTPE